MRIKYAVSVLAATAAVAPFVAFSSPPASAGPCGGRTPGSWQACGDCLKTGQNWQACSAGAPPAAPAPAQQPRPGGNAHCNSLLNSSGNDNAAVYLACCNDAVMAGQHPC